MTEHSRLDQNEPRPISSTQAERIAHLQARRARSGNHIARSTTVGAEPADAAMTTSAMTANTRNRRRRRHPALGSRIAAAGLGATSMLAIVGLLGLRDRQAITTDSTPVTEPQVIERPIQVVVHHIPATTLAPLQPTSSTTPTPAAPTGPIELTANTVVRTVTVTQAPQRSNSSGGGSGGGSSAPASNASSGGSK